MNETRRVNGWRTYRVKAGSLFLTAAAVPYEFEWRRLSEEPFEVMMVILSLPLFEEALSECYGNAAGLAVLRDHSGFEDLQLLSLLQSLRHEMSCTNASSLAVRGLGQAIAVHLARQLLRETQRRVLDIANEVGYANPSHFARLFRKQTGMTPQEYRSNPPQATPLV